MTDSDFKKLIEFITMKTGIIPGESHKTGIKKIVEKRLETMSFSSFFSLINADTREFEAFINSSTINETYFFREEKQFQLLQNKIFPEWIKKNGNKRIKIWSAACSDGVEAYSLSLLASFCQVKAEIIASDINTEVLEICSQGIFKSSSIRSGDGDAFKNLLAPYKKTDGFYEFSDSVKSTISTMKLNLSEIDVSPFVIPRDQDIIFVRNVFIYFSRELRTKILKTMAEKCLNDKGKIFVSMNEIAQIDSSIMPSCLEKVSDGNVFYFQKI